MEKMRDLSIKKAIIIYISISLVISFLWSALVIKKAEWLQEDIWRGYVDEELYYKAVMLEGDGYIANIPRPSKEVMSKFDHSISELCDFLQTYSILVNSIIGIIVAVVLFYRDKIQKPLEEMTAVTQMVANNNLDFSITYKSKDELGLLCTEFERMRAELEKNNRKMWRMIEEEKELRAALVHDIRTPLTTLRGYQEMLLDFIPEGRLSVNQTTDMLKEGMVQINRIHCFVEAMRKISSLEQRELEPEVVNLDLLRLQIEKNVRVLEKEHEKSLQIHNDNAISDFQVDIKMILEVTENLVSNAMRYAKENVKVIISEEANEIVIEVQDDGPGFNENLEQVTKAYYHSNDGDNLKHLGMGLYISRIYCEKHGGKLIIRNLPAGGASVKAIFKKG